LVLTEDELGTEDEPLIFALPLGRAFFPALFSTCCFGAASFITIFAWISSSLLALTFFGQKRVTKLEQNVNFLGIAKIKSAVLTSKGVVAIYLCPLQLLPSRSEQALFVGR
jgi:hypothetical protein